MLPRIEASMRDELTQNRLRALMQEIARTARLEEAILAEEPDDVEALEALSGLLDRPGCELRRAEVLELWATCGPAEPAELLPQPPPR